MLFHVIALRLFSLNSAPLFGKDEERCWHFYRLFLLVGKASWVSVCGTDVTVGPECTLHLLAPGNVLLTISLRDVRVFSSIKTYKVCLNFLK